MILLPYGHEQTSVRRLPWVTIGIMAVCLVAFILSGRWHPLPSEDYQIQEDVVEALEWFAEHPYLKLDPEFEETFLSGVGDEQMKEMFGYLAELRQHNPPLSVLLAEQEHLDTICARAVETFRGHTLRKWGLIPADKRLLSWVSHMFLHAGWMHLLGNMLILFLAGPFVEDRWGRPLYLGFYVVSGFVAAFFHILSVPDSAMPMIGASGAIAGVMGAFLILYGKTKIKFFYLFLLIRGTFRAPAWLMIPLWFASQLWMGLLTSELDIQVGVAYWAHIGGFAMGVGAAWFIASKKIEERFIDPNIQNKITLEVEDNNPVIEALEVRDSDPQQAFRMLSLAVMNQPKNHDGAAALWHLALQLDRAQEVAPLMLRSVSHQLTTGDRELALTQWLDVQQVVPDIQGDPRQIVRLAQALAQSDRYEDALDTLQMAMRAGGDKLDPMLALTIARTAVEIGPSTAKAAIQYVLKHPAADPEVRQRAESLLKRMESTPAEPANEPAPAGEPTGFQPGGGPSVPLSS
jgi:membrane associated rhomboid family serine protease